MRLLLRRVLASRDPVAGRRTGGSCRIWGALAAALWACSSEPNIPTTVTLSPATVSFTSLGETQQLAPLVSDQNGDALSDAAVVWSSSNVAVATVSATGLVTAKGGGSAELTATAGAATARAPVSVAQAPAQLQPVSGDGQSGSAGRMLPSPFVVQVNDALGSPVSGITVDFTAPQGGTVAPAMATTGVDGKAATNFTTGTLAGVPLQVSASIAATTISVSFKVTTVAAAPASIEAQAGDNQHAAPGGPVRVRPAVVVTDAFGNGVAGVSVAFQVISGGGSVTGASSVTGSSGIAQAGSWTLGAGSNTLRAIAAGANLAGNPVTFSASGIVSSFDIEVRFLSGSTPSQRQAFADARLRWEALVTGDLEDFPLQTTADDCVPGTPALNETVDDVLILVTLKSIDGPGNILAGAGPCYVRSPGDGLTILGTMKFDTDDLDMLESEGILSQVIVHEMGHVLGFGTLWPFQGLLADASVPPATGTDPHFTGPGALAAFDAAGGTAYTGGSKVPVENIGGEGTADSHWRESVFVNELMTGFIGPGENPLSAVTAASLADQGYTVNLAAADGLTLTGVSLRAFGQARSIHLQNDILRRPIKTVDRRGRVTGEFRR